MHNLKIQLLEDLKLVSRGTYNIALHPRLNHTHRHSFRSFLSYQEKEKSSDYQRPPANVPWPQMLSGHDFALSHGRPLCFCLLSLISWGPWHSPFSPWVRSTCQFFFRNRLQRLLFPADPLASGRSCNCWRNPPTQTWVKRWWPHFLRTVPGDGSYPLPHRPPQSPPSANSTPGWGRLPPAWPHTPAHTCFPGQPRGPGQPRPFLAPLDGVSGLLHAPLCFLWRVPALTHPGEERLSTCSPLLQVLLGSDVTHSAGVVLPPHHRTACSLLDSYSKGRSHWDSCRSHGIFEKSNGTWEMWMMGYN